MHGDADAAAPVYGLQGNRQLGSRIARRRVCTTGGMATATTEQAFEEIGESPAGTTTPEHLLEVELRTAPRPLAEAPRRRPDLVARTVPPRPQLVIRLALGRITQGLVGLIDRLEAFFGAFFLADIGVIFSGQTPVGRLDLRLACAGLNPQCLVIVLEFHHCSVRRPRDEVTPSTKAHRVRLVSPLK